MKAGCSGDIAIDALIEVVRFLLDNFDFSRLDDLEQAQLGGLFEKLDKLAKDRRGRSDDEAAK